MRVALIADPIVPVPPVHYGGTERVVASLCQGLAERGHDVTLLAGPGSRLPVRLVEHRAPGRSFPSRAQRKLLFQTLSLWACRGADVVHNFGRVDYLWALMRTKRPLVHTFQNPITQNEVGFLLSRPRPALKLVSASDHQRRAFEQAGDWSTVHNGIDPRTFPFVERPTGERYLAFLGRLTANKGVREAIEVARAAGVRLRIAGNVSGEPGGREYFETQVSPRLGDDVEYVGEVNDEKKAAFLGGALALLFPIQWDEPFGIVMIEANACGTPVVALRRGPVPEVVVHGRTGFVCAGINEMVQAVRRIDEIDRADCRRHCEKRFSTDAMTESYLSVYRAARESKGVT